MLCKLCLIYFSWTNLFSVFCLLPSDYKFLQTMQTPSAKLSIAMSIFICQQTKYKYKTEIIKNYFLETFNNFFLSLTLSDMFIVPRIKNIHKVSYIAIQILND